MDSHFTAVSVDYNSIYISYAVNVECTDLSYAVIVDFITCINTLTDSTL